MAKRLTTELELPAAHSAALRRIHRALSLSTDSGAFMRDALDELCALIRPAAAHILTIDRDGDAMLVRASTGQAPAASVGPRQPLPAIMRALDAGQASLLDQPGQKLNDRCRSWDTSPFLFGVMPRYLGRLERDDALALIRQIQSPAPPAIDGAVAEAVLAATDGHPFLTQWLCNRLWIDGGLRAPTADDMIPDLSLVNVFQLDYNYLAPIERRILRCLAYVESLDDQGLLAQLGVTLADLQLRYLIQSLVELCYVRRASEGYSTGNRLLHAWLQFWATDEPEATVSDAAAVDQADEEQQRIMGLATAHKRRLRVLEEQQAMKGMNAPAEIVLDIENIKAELAKLDAQLAGLRARTPG